MGRDPAGRDRVGLRPKKATGSSGNIQKFEYYKIIRVFCLLRGSKFQKLKEINLIFSNLKENGPIYENQI
jgi:hypothetical protein